MAVKTEQQLLAEASSGKPITASLMTDVVNTIFSRGASDTLVYSFGITASDTISNILSTSGVTLAQSALLVIYNNGNSDVYVTYIEAGAGVSSRSISIPAETFGLIFYYDYEGGYIYAPFASQIV